MAESAGIRTERFAMPVENLRCEIGQRQPAERRCGAWEVSIHERAIEPERLEQLAAAVSAEGADAHLREDPEQAALERVPIGTGSTAAAPASASTIAPPRYGNAAEAP